MEFHSPYSAGNYLCFTGIYSPYTQSMVALNSECDDDYITNGFGIWSPFGQTKQNCLVGGTWRTSCQDGTESRTRFESS